MIFACFFQAILDFYSSFNNFKVAASGVVTLLISEIMKISLNWIKEFVDIQIPQKKALEFKKNLADLLTSRTCEVEAYEDQSERLNNVIVGKVLKLRPHKNATKLVLADTDIGDSIVQIVCGGKNLREGMLVAVALPGALVDWHGTGELVELKETEIRGEKSFGMICAGEEIGLQKSAPEEIMDLSYLEVAAGTALAGVLHLNDFIFEIDNKSVTHRPDLWGHYGLAREFAAFLNKPLKKYEKTVGIEKIKFPRHGEAVKIEISDEKICQRFSSCIMTSIRIEESPQWLKARLLSCGVKPVNNIVDITNYVALELGQPMHAFDRKIVGTDYFLVRHAKNGEIIQTIDHKMRHLDPQDVVITDGKKPLVIAGIMGGKESEINEKTTEIILESANWNPLLVRKTSQKLGLRTESSQRYEKGLDPLLTEPALKRACQLIMKLCPSAKIAGEMTDVKNFRLRNPQISLSLANLERKLGIKIPKKEVISILNRFEFGVFAKNNSLIASAPSFRTIRDISIEDDIIEEVARMYGYEKIPTLLPHLPIKLPHENRERKLKHWCRDILSMTLGFTEASHYSFYGKNDFEKCLLSENIHLAVENPLSEDQTHLRASLLPNLLKSAGQNLNYFDSFKIYEIGRQYKMQKGSYFPLEEKFICGIVADKNTRADVFLEVKGAVYDFLKMLPLKSFDFEETAENPPYAHPKKCIQIVNRNKEKAVLGYVFELHPAVAKNFDITASIGVFEINFSLLSSLPKFDLKYAFISKFPGIDIDVSILTNRKTKHIDIEKLIAGSEKHLIQKISLIDIFDDSSLGENKKSMTYRVKIQSNEKTLTDEDMHLVQKKIFENLQNAGHQIRGL